MQTVNGAAAEFFVPGRLQSALTQLAQGEGATLFMALLSVFQVLLHRYSHQTDFCVGTPIANRTRGEVEGLIGFFANTLVIRGRLSPPRHIAISCAMSATQRSPHTNIRTSPLSR